MCVHAHKHGYVCVHAHKHGYVCVCVLVRFCVKLSAVITVLRGKLFNVLAYPSNRSLPLPHNLQAAYTHTHTHMHAHTKACAKVHGGLNFWLTFTTHTHRRCKMQPSACMHSYTQICTHTTIEELRLYSQTHSQNHMFTCAPSFSYKLLFHTHKLRLVRTLG